MGYAMKGFGGFGNPPLKQNKTMKHPRISLPGKGKKLFEMSNEELKALGFGPKKIKEIMADSAKNQMTQEEVLEDMNPRTRTAK